ncbi:hypothetical protein H2203_006112 [Taxawa tesnikishii (nom. ined.)]|nr:hypothetical protein H2203_006112 [Dothideales sp. JES 119]
MSSTTPYVGQSYEQDPRWTAARLLRAERVLEVGTLGGYSTIWLASTAPSIKVTTVEVNSAHAACAREAIDAAGLGDRVEILEGAGVDVLPGLRRQVEEGKRKPFDFVFIDADKENNLNYLNESIPMARQGACIIVDNVVRKGSLADEETAKTDSRVQGARAVVEGAGKDDRVEGVVMQMVGEKNYDGFLILSVK